MPHPHQASNLIQGLEKFAHQSPHHVAIDTGQNTISYQELHQKSIGLAQHLVKWGCEKGDRVVFILPNGIPSLISIYGILNAGAVYIAIHPSMPKEKQKDIIEDAAPKVIITETQDDIDQLEITPSAYHHLDHKIFQEVCDKHDQTKLPDVVGQDDCYIMYTSGTTGKPKGVQLQHQQVCSFIHWASQHFDYTSRDRVANHSSYGFDLSVLDIFASSHAGATLCPITQKGDLAFPGTFIKKMKISIWCSVPSTLGMILLSKQLDASVCEHLRMAIVCGEALQINYAKSWVEQFPSIPLYNTYGPTEAAVLCTSHRVSPDDFINDASSITIGKPFPTTQLHVLNTNLEPTPQGEVGRLFISGEQVCKGYWKRPELNRQVFQSAPSLKVERMYQTGDLVRYDDQQKLHWVGREDSQVQISGYRVELGEIEQKLLRSGLCDEIGVIVIEEQERPQIVAAFSTPNTENPKVVEKEFEQYARRELEHYMIPKKFFSMKNLPKNKNGKIDRNAIKKLIH